MKRLVAMIPLLLFGISWPTGLGQPAPGAPSHAEAKGKSVELNGHTFKLPTGFEIELVAARPLIDRPVVADFDEQGRLYVADSSGTNEPVQQQLQKKPHRIVRLEDVDGDGRFDKRTIFADKMMFPEGTMWYAGSLYVAAPPSIWKLTDTDNDGVADERVEWFKGKTLTGCANDLHGPYLGLDGWIYWCKGAFAIQAYPRPSGLPQLAEAAGGGRRFVTRAAHIFRCRPDGSGIEPVMTGGMDNPVDVVFTPSGERIFTTTFFQHPGGGQRDGLIHAIYGGIYGKDHDVIYEHKWTGPHVMPVLTHMGAAAPAGLTRYEGRTFGAEYHNNLFAALFNMQKVTRHVLTPHGATFQSRDEDFLVSSNRDFHPTDVLEDADGSLLVVDTGGWYKLCCPTSQLHKPDVLGAIYRIRRTGGPRVDDPRGLKLSWSKLKPENLAQLLEDARPAVRHRAVQTLAEKGADALPALAAIIRSGRTLEPRQLAIWAATRIPDLTARTAVRAALTDSTEPVRQAAIHSVNVWRDKEAVPLLLPLLESGSPQTRRAAAEALGRTADKTAVPALLEALQNPVDRVLEHSLIFALIEIADPQATAAGLQSESIFVRRAVMIALDQMDGGKLDPATAARELKSQNSVMQETAWWIVGRHPEWGSHLGGFLREQLAAKDRSPAEHEEWVRRLALLARTPTVQDLLAEQLRSPASSRESRRLTLRAMARAGLKTAPNAWIAGLVQVLASGEQDLIEEAVSTLRSLPIKKERAGDVTPSLLKIAETAELPAGVRTAALAGIPGGLTEVKPPLFDFLRARLEPAEPVSVRTLAADVISRAKLTSEQLALLADCFKMAGPMEVERLLDAFAQSADDQVGLQLVKALTASPARSALRREMLKAKLAKFGPAVQKQAEELYAALDVDAAQQKAILERLLGSLNGGDIRRGQAVFNSTKAACASCHTIGYLGGKSGPDLTHIGRIRTERDLLEAIIFPSASFVRSYEPVVISTKDGRTVNGVLRKDAPDELVLATGPDEEVRIARADVEEMQASRVSIMPAGLDQQLTPRELADLVAFLKACK